LNWELPPLFREKYRMKKCLRKKGEGKKIREREGKGVSKFGVFVLAKEFVEKNNLSRFSVNKIICLDFFVLLKKRFHEAK